MPLNSIDNYLEIIFVSLIHFAYKTLALFNDVSWLKFCNKHAWQNFASSSSIQSIASIVSTLGNTMQNTLSEIARSMLPLRLVNYYYCPLLEVWPLPPFSICLGPILFIDSHSFVSVSSYIMVQPFKPLLSFDVLLLYYCLINFFSYNHVKICRWLYYSLWLGWTGSVLFWSALPNMHLVHSYMAISSHSYPLQEPITTHSC